MRTKQDKLLVLFAMLAGLIGGILASSLFMAVPVLAGKKQERIDAKTIRAETIRANRILLEGDRGLEGVHMKMHSGGLMLADKKSGASIMIGLTDEGESWLTLGGKDGFVQVNIDNGTPALNLMKKDKAFAYISVDENATLYLRTKDEASTIWLTAEPEAPSLRFYSGSKDDGSSPQVVLSMPEGSPRLLLWGKKGSVIAGAEIPSLSLHDKDKKMIWNAP